MKSDPLDPNRGFSLKRFLSNTNSGTPVISKKRKTIVSLSKSRSNTCSQASQQSEPLDTNIEKVKVKADDYGYCVEDIKDTNADVTDASVTKKSFELDPRNQIATTNLPLMKNELDEEQSIKVERDVSIKEEPIEREMCDLPIAEDFKDDIFTKEDIAIKNERIDFHLPDNDASTHLLQEYTCPICDQDLTGVKSSYMRQNHVESCITEQSTFTEVQELEFDCCVFCGKDLSRFKSNQRQYHLNSCLDDVQQIEEAEMAAIEKEKDEMFAGQSVPFLSTLELCPVCHEFDPFTNRTLKQKMKHIKQCAKQNRLSLNQLLKKFQWIGWGHLPVAAKEPSSADNPLLSSSIPTTVNIPDHQLVAYVQNLCNGDDDNDFTENDIIHKTRLVLPTAKEDMDSEELQTAMALSRSLNQPQTKRKHRLHPSNERDWNAANIWCVEESRLKAFAKLDELLFSDPKDKSEMPLEDTSLGDSRLNIPSENDHFYWNLTSNKDNNWNNSNTFVSLFIHDLRRDQK